MYEFFALILHDKSWNKPFNKLIYRKFQLMKETLVSIITPMYKGAAYVGETIESVIAQTYANWEMIIVDDCSPDEGAGIAVVKKYIEKDKRIKLIESKVNKGSSGARNIALREADGEYIAFLDSDDIWMPDFLQKQLDFMKEKQAPIVFSSYKRIDEKTKHEILLPFIVPSIVTYKTMLKTCPIFPSTSIYDVKLIGKTFFNEKMGSLRDDYVYWLSILKRVPAAYGNKEQLAYYRMRKESITADKKKVIIPQWRVLRDVEKLSFLKCVYYISAWAVISYFKYRK